MIAQTTDIFRYCVETILIKPDKLFTDDLIHYTSDVTAKNGLIIIPSGFFNKTVYGTARSLDLIKVHKINNYIGLFGLPEVEYGDNRIVLHSDIIASAFFLLSRYEEMVRRDVRDEHGRILGRDSIAFMNGFLDRPIIDEYESLLYDLLIKLGVNIEKRHKGIRKIYLTHDVDVPWKWDTYRVVVKETLQRVRENLFSIHEPFLSKLGVLKGKDPYDCFKWILTYDQEFKRNTSSVMVESVFFLLVGGSDIRDGRCYLKDFRMRGLLNAIKGAGAKIGLHSSYYAGKNPHQIRDERASLEGIVCEKVVWNRHHFLASREPEDMAFLEQYGITDDFTMGYPDVVGFRLGTTRSVNWFNPVQLRKTNLVLHPLTVMDCTLDDERYMNLDYDAAYSVCIDLFSTIKKHGGDIVLLWHNSTLSSVEQSETYYQQKLYLKLMEYLVKQQ